MVDLGKFQQIQAFDLVFEYEVLPTLEDAQAATTPVYGQAWQYKIEGSNDKSSWDMLWDNTANTDFSKEQYGKIAEEYANNKYQYVRVTLTQLPLPGQAFSFNVLISTWNNSGGQDGAASIRMYPEIRMLTAAVSCAVSRITISDSEGSFAKTGSLSTSDEIFSCFSLRIQYVIVETGI